MIVFVHDCSDEYNNTQYDRGHARSVAGCDTADNNEFLVIILVNCVNNII